MNFFKIIIGSLMVFVGGVALAAVASEKTSLAKKEVFTTGFPKYFRFRGWERNIEPYEVWAGRLENAAGMIRKCVPEEIRDVAPIHTKWTEPYARNHPEKLLLLHLNGEARQVMDFPEVHHRYFPGHWVYEPGTRLTEDAGADQSRLRVHDVKVFNSKGYLDHKTKERYPQHIALIPLDAQGHRVWDATEYTILKSINAKDGTIEVQRGAIFSKAHAFKGGTAEVVPIAAGVWGGRPMWYYNLSADCPKDRNGQNAAEVFIAEIAGWFGPGGLLHAFDGIAFDVNYFEPRENFDTDNDGHSDGGIVHGINRWRAGDWQFLKGLRQALGENRIITSDGQLTSNQRAVGVLDGIESEGPVEPIDSFRGISRTINTHLYWKENNPRPLDFRYVVLKLNTPYDAAHGEQLRRFASALACCLEASVTLGEISEQTHTTAGSQGAARQPDRDARYLPEPFKASGSLGLPKGPLLRLAQKTPDLLKGVSLKEIITLDGCVAEQTPEGLVLSPASGHKGDGFGFALKALAVPSGDLTVFADMQALDPLEGFTGNDYVPRRMDADFSPLPNYGETPKLNAFYHELYGYFGTHRPSLLSFYFRRPGRTAEPVELAFRVEGRGRVLLRSLTVHSAPELVCRQFANATVVVNPSLKPVTTQIPGLAAPVTVPALDAVFISKAAKP